MNKVHICKQGRWHFIFLKDTVFDALVQAEIVRFVNTVWALRPYTKDYSELYMNKPFQRDYELGDFQIKDNNGNFKPAIEEK